MNQMDKLLILIPQMEVIEFIGLARLLKVKTTEEVNPSAAEPSERFAPRDFTDVLNDVLQNFDRAPRARKREILQLVKAATKKR